MRQDVGEGLRAPGPLWGVLPCQHISACTSSEGSPKAYCLGFLYVVSLHWHDYLNHWPLVIKLNCQPLLP